jgi:hypothetical protein
VIRFIQNPYDEDLAKLFIDSNCEWRLGTLGIEIAVFNSERLSAGKVHFALKRSANEMQAPVLALDILEIIRMRGAPSIPESDRGGQIIIQNAYLDYFEFNTGVDLSGVIFKELIADEIFIDRQGGTVLGPKMVDSMIGRAHGVVRRADVPAAIIDEATTIDSFDMDVDAVKVVWKQLLPVGTRVLLASLTKLFAQAGRARKENAFPRGLDDNERPYVPDVLSLLQRHGFAFPQRAGGPPIWIANRALAKDALSILRAPQEHSHPILKEAREL